MQITVADGHKFSAVRHLSQRLLDHSTRQKTQFLPTAPAFDVLVGCDPIRILHRSFAFIKLNSLDHPVALFV